MELMSVSYNLIVSPDTWEDISSYIEYIILVCDAPKTGKKHYDDLLSVLEKIEKFPELNSIRNHSSLAKYGVNVRLANYKKMTFIYTVNGNTVNVHRLLPASMIP